MTLTLDDARRRWAATQHLDGARRTSSLADALAETGWIRTLGGAEAYIAFGARVEGVTREAVDEAVASGELLILPCVRGCVYLVPRQHASLALRIADRLSSRRMARDFEKVGCGADETGRVREAVLEALSDAKLSTQQLRKQLPEGVVRSFGAAGKKIGLSSNLPPVLRRMELDGEIVRRPIDNRLDHERYVWERTDESLIRDDHDILADMARLYFQWAGPASLAEFVAWTGFTKTDAKKAMAAIDVEPVNVEGIGESFQLAGRELTEAAPRLTWLPAFDGLFGLREDGKWLSDPAYHDLPVGSFGRKPVLSLGEIRQPLERTLCWDGRIVGLWAWDNEANTVEHGIFDTNVPDEALADVEADLDRAQAVFDSLGHGKIFSIDKPKSMQARVERVKGLG